MEYPWIKIEDLSRFMLKGGITQYHPNDPRHTKYWRDLKRKCIEGFWGEDFGKFRYMPGRLFFYGHFGSIIDTDETEKVRRVMRPLIRDIEWERAYLYLVAEGFSGWSNDEQYTSNWKVLTLSYDSPMTARQQLELLRPDGRFKEFIPPHENVKKLHDFPKGLPLYSNDAKNIMEMGSRGGGKSYWYSIGGAQYRLCFDGVKYYTEENIQNPPTASVLLGSGRTDKSSEFAAKTEASMNELAKDPTLGAWGSLGDEDYEPSPIYKEMSGSISPNNKDNPYRHEYSMRLNGQWIDGFGTGSKMFHVSYAVNKKDGADAGAGGRYNDVYYEEIGLTELLIEAYNSNKATTGTGSVKFGVQAFLGTSGNMATVIPAKKMFSHPDDYDIISFPDYWEGSGKIGFFLPAYITNNNFKDKNGNTDVEAAKAYYAAEEARAAKSDDPSILRYQRMNFPNKPSDMWQTNKGSILPAAEAEEREKELTLNNLYQKLGTPVKLRWTEANAKRVEYEIDHTAEPFYEWPLESNSMRKTLDGSILIFDWPYETGGITPNDMYFATHDPYVSDDWDKGGSLGVIHVWLHPKYWTSRMPSCGPLVCSYIGKARGGKKEFYDNAQKLLAFYGNPTRGFVVEADRGEYCFSQFLSKGLADLLALRPNFQLSGKQTVIPYGYTVGNRVQKIEYLDNLSDFLLKDIEVNGVKKKLIYTISCIFTIRQIKMYDLNKGNYDAVSSILLVPIFERQEEIRTELALRKKHIKKNPMAFIVTNPKLLKNENYNSYFESR
jgi:hypothetical protein